jgi:luciferase family oxidoreductase group 1
LIKRSLQLGILDLGHPMYAIEAAPVAERLGYSRYWLAEHHGGTSGSASPDLLTALVAGLTDRIRVGPGGVILHFRSPLKVAEDFRLLSFFFPGRIDLGLVRGLAEPIVVTALLDTRPRLPSSEEHGRRVADVCGLLRGTLPKGHPLENVSIPPPGHIEPPQIWVLGSSSLETAAVAAELGVAFCIGEHLVSGPGAHGPDAIRHYRDQFRPSHWLSAPLWSVCAGGCCADKEAVARKAVEGLPSYFRTSWIGTPVQCGEQICEIADRYETREVIVCDLGQGPIAAKVRSYELLADVLLQRPVS